jgi:DNA-binding IclR family transcriptional regulator
MARSANGSTGIQSIEVGAPLLAALVTAPGPLTLTALAAAAGMTRSKAHKYLTSFGRVGLVAQNPITGRYTIGRLAIELGFAALRRLDMVEIAQEALDDLRDRLDMTASLTIWANHGPTIVRRAENRQSVSLVVQLGTVLPVLTSSNGRIFGAFLDRRTTQELIAAELAVPKGPAHKAGLRNAADVDALMAKVRRDGIASAAGTVHTGIIGISAPVFDHTNRLVAALTVVGVDGMYDPAPTREPARTLAATAAALSRSIGAPEAADTDDKAVATRRRER